MKNSILANKEDCAVILQFGSFTGPRIRTKAAASQASIKRAIAESNRKIGAVVSSAPSKKSNEVDPPIILKFPKKSSSQ